MSNELTPIPLDKSGPVVKDLVQKINGMITEGFDDRTVIFKSYGAVLTILGQLEVQTANLQQYRKNDLASELAVLQGQLNTMKRLVNKLWDASGLEDKE